MPTIHVRARVFATTDEAFQHLDASGEGDHVIALQGKHYVIGQAEAQRLDAAGITFAYLHIHNLPDGSARIVAVPIH